MPKGPSKFGNEALGSSRLPATDKATPPARETPPSPDSLVPPHFGREPVVRMGAEERDEAFPVTVRKDYVLGAEGGSDVINAPQPTAGPLISGDPQAGKSSGADVSARGEAGSLTANVSFVADEGGIHFEVPSSTLKVKTPAPTVEVKRRKRVVGQIQNKRQVLAQSRILILALEQAVAYQPELHDNQPKPELYAELQMGDPTARNDIQELIVELKKLNAFLQATRTARSSDKPVIDVKKHLNTFLSKAAATAGVGAGGLVIAVAATILQNLGVDFSILAPALNRAHR